MAELPTVFEGWYWGVDHYPPEDRSFLLCCGLDGHDVMIGYMNGTQVEAIGLAYNGIVVFEGRQVWWREIPSVPRYVPNSEVERLYGTDYPKAGKPMSKASDSELRNYFGSAYSYRPTNALESPWGDGKSLVTQSHNTDKLVDDRTKLLTQDTKWSTREFIKKVKLWAATTNKE